MADVVLIGEKACDRRGPGDLGVEFIEGAADQFRYDGAQIPHRPARRLIQFDEIEALPEGTVGLLGCHGGSLYLAQGAGRNFCATGFGEYG